MRRALAVLLLAACGSSAPTTANRGQVTVTSTTFGLPGQTYTQVFAAAQFIANDVALAGCPTRTIGACRAEVSCQPQLVGHDTDGGDTRYASAGPVTISGGDQPIMLDVMTAGMFPGQYATFNAYQVVYVPGQQLVARAAGAEVPAFTVGVLAPAEVTMTAPVTPTTGGPLLVPRSQPLQLSWTGGTAGTVDLTLYTVMPPSAINCSFDAAAGGGTVEAAALAALSAGPAQVGLSQSSRAQATAGAWTIDIVAGTTPVDVRGNSYYLSVTLQ